jgi:hypothetical protein
MWQRNEKGDVKRKRKKPDLGLCSTLDYFDVGLTHNFDSIGSESICTGEKGSCGWYLCSSIFVVELLTVKGFC